MKRIENGDSEELQAMLQNLELPEVQMPARQRRLRETLLATGYLEKEDVLLSTYRKAIGGIKMKTRAWKLVASVAMVFLALGAYITFFTAPRAVASLALQLNPAVSLTLSERNSVIDAEGLDAQGASLLAGLDVTGKEVREALRIIAGALHEAGLLGSERRIVVALHPVGDRWGEAELANLAGAVRQALDGYLAEQGLPGEVKIVVLTAELADAVRAAGMLPAAYVDLVAAVGPATAMQVLNLPKELGLDPALFEEEFDTITASLIDMLEAGIAEEAALAMLKGALTADPTLEELTTITAAMIDLHQAGATPEDILALFRLLEEQVATGIERALLLEEISTIAAAKIDLLEAEIPAATALAVLRMALQAGPTLEELTTITAAMIDLVVEEGLSAEEALARIQAAIEVDPTLQNLDDLIETPGEEEADEAAGTDGVQPDQPAADPPAEEGDEAAGTDGVQPDQPAADPPAEEGDEAAGTDGVQPDQPAADPPAEAGAEAAETGGLWPDRPEAGPPVEE
jgi:hypothetical protein